MLGATGPLAPGACCLPLPLVLSMPEATTSLALAEPDLAMNEISSFTESCSMHSHPRHRLHWRVRDTPRVIFWGRFRLFKWQNQTTGRSKQVSTLYAPAASAPDLVVPVLILHVCPEAGDQKLLQAGEERSCAEHKGTELTGHQKTVHQAVYAH